MKHSTHLPFVTILFALVFAFSCQDNKKSIPNEITLDTIEVAKVHHLDTDSASPSCSLKLSYIVPTKLRDDSVLSKIQKELNTFFFDDEMYEDLSPQKAADLYVTHYVENYKKDADKMDADEEHDIVTPNNRYYSIYKTLESNVIFNKSDILSYQRISVDFKGNKNSSTLCQNIVFNLQNGKVLTEDDIYRDGYKEVLNKLALYKILEQNKVKSVDALTSLGFWLEDFTTNDNFFANDKGITYVFNEEEYASRVNGKITISFGYDELEDILLPNSPISALLGK